jgi:hypothetical protein
MFDKARAKANQTHGGYIYPCPMDRAVMQRWGISPPEFTAAIAANSTDDRILTWVSQRVPPDRMQAANSWVVSQKESLDRHDAEEGVPGAIAPRSQMYYVIAGLAAAVLVLLFKWFMRHGLGH